MCIRDRLQPGMQAPPHPMAPGKTDDDYYLGNVAGLQERSDSRISPGDQEVTTS